jgi:uncharacterized membrane protein YidH (DUF202 family)
MRRPASRGLAAGVALATLVFCLSAYLPGTEESLVSWAGLSVVLAAGVAGLVTAVLVARAVLRRTRAVHDIERGRRSLATLAVLLGVAGWLVVAVAAPLVVDRPDAGLRLAVALVSGGFVALAVGGLAVRVAVALSVSHAWRPRATAAGAVADTAVLAAPAVGCPSGGPCLDTPNGLVAAVAGVDAGAVAPTYAAVVVAGGLVVGATLGNAARHRQTRSPPGPWRPTRHSRSRRPPPGSRAPSGRWRGRQRRTTARYLPVLVGTVSGTGAVAVHAAGSPER